MPYIKGYRVSRCSFEKGDKMSWPIRFEGLNHCNNLTNANLPGHYFGQYNIALNFCCQ